MTRNFTLTVALLASAISQVTIGQVGVLNSSEMMPPGSSVTLRLGLTTLPVDTNLQGTGQVWDLSSLQPTGDPGSIDYLAAADAPQASSFPTANYFMYESLTSRYIYYEKTSSELERIGSYQTSLNTFTDPRTELVFPMQSGTSYTDYFLSAGTGGGDYYVDCLGSGTLQLPGATYNDVLLVRYVQVSFFYSITQYIWTSAANGAQLVIYTPPNALTSGGVLYATTMEVGIDEAGTGVALRVHSLADGSLYLTYSSDEQVQWTIHDAAGRSLKEGNFAAAPSPVSEQIGSAGLPHGLLLITLQGKVSGQKTTWKLVR